MKKLLLFLSLFAFTANAQYTKLFDFDGTNSGSFPYGSLVSDGTYLYGLTYQGGTNNFGTVFKLKTDGTGYTVLHHFTGGTDGGASRSSLIYDGTYLYGTTASTVFKLKTDGTSYSVLHNFTGNPDGSAAFGSLYNDGTYLYGTTFSGGTTPNGAQGTIYKLMPDGSNYSKIFDFGAPNSLGAGAPNAALISDGTYLYGTTTAGGSTTSPCAGTVFKILPNGSNFSIVKTFTNNFNDGAAPYGDLLYDGTYLYGTLSQSGAFNNGGLFKVKPDGTGFTKFFNFTNSDGNFATGALIIQGGYLYGLNKYKLYRITVNGTNYSNLYSFVGGVNGHDPYGSLISDGSNFYGMTNIGGVNNKGVIFKYNLLTVGLNEPNANSLQQIQISPNPNTGIFNINNSNLNFNTQNSVEIYDMFGRLLLTKNNVKADELFNLEVKNGMYLVKYVDGKNTYSQKVVIQN